MESARRWPYPSGDDFLEVDFESQLRLVQCMVTDNRAKAGWDKLSKITKCIRDKKGFCGSVLHQIVTVCSCYAISRKEGVRDRVDRFKNITGALSVIKNNLELDGEFFRECRLAQSNKNSMFAAQLKQAMAAHFKRLAPESKFIDSILMEEVFDLLEDNPFSMLDVLQPVVARLANEPPLTTKMNLDESNEIHFQKAMTRFWLERLNKPLYGVTADFSNALFDVAITENKVRDRVKKK